MVTTVAKNKNIFHQEEQISLTYMHKQSWGYFGLEIIVCVIQPISDPLISQDLANIAISEKEEQNLFGRVCSDTISKAIEDSVKNTFFNKLSTHHREYEWSGTGGLKNNYGPTMLDLLFKIINPESSIGVSNLKD